MSAQITVNVAGSERSVPAQTTASDLFGEDRAVVVARVNGELRDLAHVLADGDSVEPVRIHEEEGLAVLRHSTAHVLAQAVQEVNPRPGWASARPCATASTTTSTSRTRSTPTT